MAYIAPIPPNLDVSGPLTLDAREGILKLLEEGVPIGTCLDFFGVHPAAFRDWMTIGGQQPDTPQGQFYIAARKANAVFEIEVTKNLAKHAKGTGKGAGQLALEILSRRNNAHWGKREDRRSIPAEELDSLIEHEFTRLAASNAGQLPAPTPLQQPADGDVAGGGLEILGPGSEDGFAEQATPAKSFAGLRSQVRSKRRT